MAAITKIVPANPTAFLCETIAIVNQVAASTTVRKAIPVPPWAKYATIVVGSLTIAGTTPTFDFVVRRYDSAANAYGQPDDGFLIPLGGWDGITQKVGQTDTDTVIDIGPQVVTDDTGSATLSDQYGVTAVLPPWLVYVYTTTDSLDDADYSATISCYFRAD
jgi:hypothetical protein